ncbi:MAG: EF-P 5-aminopentanol modification-associated protein YfmH [Oscillospiraceae bacterium]
MRKLEYPSIGETMYRDTLPNGLRLSVIPKPGFHRNCAFFATDYGGADRRFRLGGELIDTPAGVAHFLEHKMFDMPGGDNVITFFAGNGARDNAFTSAGMTAYYFEGTEKFDENLRMLLKFVSTPYFTPESVAKEQGIIGQEIRMCEDDPGDVGYEGLMGCLYAHHPIREAVIGTVESIAAITDETLYNCHRVFYHPVNMCLCVVGDVDPERVRAIAAETLPTESGEKPVSDYGQPEPETPVQRRFAKAMAVSAPQFLIGAKLTPAAGGDEMLRQKLVCGLALSYLFGRSSPFYSRLYELGLISDSFFVQSDHTAGTFTAFAGGESRDPEAVYDAVCAEIRDAVEKGLDPVRFDRLKRAGYGSRVRALSSFMGLCESMADGCFGGYNCLDSFAMVESVTAQEVRAFLAEQFDPSRLAMSVITPLGAGKEENP